MKDRELDTATPSPRASARMLTVPRGEQSPIPWVPQLCNLRRFAWSEPQDGCFQEPGWTVSALVVQALPILPASAHPSGSTAHPTILYDRFWSNGAPWSPPTAERSVQQD